MTRWIVRGRRLLVAGCMLALAACQSIPPPPANAGAQVLITTPFFPQRDYQCGPATLATMLGWSGLVVSDQDLVEEVWLGPSGALAMELAAAARTRGRLVYPLSTAEQLFAALNREQPVLVMQNLGLKRWPRRHFAVVIGYRNDGYTLLLNSGTEQHMKLSWRRFLRSWAAADYQAWLVLPPEQLPATVESVKLVQALEDLTYNAGPLAAAPFWEQAGDQYRNDFLIQFGYGNHLWQNGQPAAAIAAFRAATLARPDVGAGWHNLVLALAGQGCLVRAGQALEQGLERADPAPLQPLKGYLEELEPAAASCDI